VSRRPALNLSRLDQADDIPNEEFLDQRVWAPARIMELARQRGTERVKHFETTYRANLRSRLLGR
jgi:hypothetical protein